VRSGFNGGESDAGGEEILTAKNAKSAKKNKKNLGVLTCTCARCKCSGLRGSKNDGAGVKGWESSVRRTCRD
jgi:hypothetical protein